MLFFGLYNIIVYIHNLKNGEKQLKENIKPALSVFGKQVLLGVMSIFLTLSLMVLSLFAFTQVNGYRASVYEKDGKTLVTTYTHFAADGEDAKKADYEEKGYIVATENTRTAISKGGNAAYYIVLQTICIILIIGFIYHPLWHIGAKDSNAVNFNRRKEDVFRGLKIGILGTVPLFLLMAIILIFGKNVFNIGFLSMIFAQYHSFIRIISGSVLLVKDLAIWQSLLMFLPLLIVPLVAFIAYLLGYKDISLSEKLIYTKNTKRG